MYVCEHALLLPLCISWVLRERFNDLIAGSIRCIVWICHGFFWFPFHGKMNIFNNSQKDLFFSLSHLIKIWFFTFNFNTFSVFFLFRNWSNWGVQMAKSGWLSTIRANVWRWVKSKLFIVLFITVPLCKA